MKQRAVSAEERIFSLILALVASPAGLTRDELLASVHGYAQDYTHGVSNASLERKFERDKSDLRTLGIPLETVDSAQHPGDNQFTRYRIQKALLEVPENLTFTRDELALIRAAALAWSEGSLTEDSRRALTKLQARASHIDTSLIGVAPRLHIAEPPEAKLRAAIRGGNVVTFEYRKPDDPRPLIRRVSPLRLHQADARWHLIAFDHDRHDYRVFLLSRIIGRVTETSVAIDAEHAHNVSEVIGRMETLREQQVARLLVDPGSRAEARLRPRAKQPTGHGGELHVHTLDFAALASELLAYGREVVVLDPPELQQHMHALVQHIVRQHATGAGQSESEGIA